MIKLILQQIRTMSTNKYDGVFQQRIRASSVEALTLQPALKQRGTLRQKHMNLNDDDITVHERVSSTLIPNNKNFYSLPELHTQKFSRATPRQDEFSSKKVTLKDQSKDYQFAKAVDSYGKLKNNRIPVLQNLRGGHKDSIQVQEQNNLLKNKQSVEQQQRLKKVLNLQKQPHTTVRRHNLPHVGSFSSIQSINMNSEKEPHTDNNRLANMAQRMAIPDQSMNLGDVSTQSVSQQYVKVLIDSKNDAQGHELELMHNKYIALELQFFELKDQRDSLLEELQNLKGQLDESLKQADHMKEINKELVTQVNFLPPANAAFNDFSPIRENNHERGSRSSGSPDASDVQQDELMEPSRIHHLYQDLYLTDLKSELNKTTQKVQQQKFKTIEQEITIRDFKEKLLEKQKIIQRYRQMATDLQKQRSTKLSWAGTSNVSGGSHYKDNDYHDGGINEMSGHNTTSHYSKNTMKINYNVLTDLNKLRDCLQSVDLMKKAKLPLVVTEHLLKIIKAACSCDVVQVFTNEEVRSGVKPPDSIQIQTMSFENKYVHTMGLKDNILMEPLLKSQREAQRPQRTQAFMTYPVFDEDNNPYGFIQITSLKRKNQILKGFTNSDELYLQMIATIFQLKLISLRATIQKMDTRKKVEMSQRVCDEISSQRTLSDLVLASDVLKGYLGFEGVAILYKDLSNEMLIHIDPNPNEEEQALIKKIKGKLDQKITLTNDERISYLELQMKEGTKHKYTNNTGITGQVFQKQEIVCNDNINLLTKFFPSIDNLSHVREIKSLMIAPIFGHALPEDEEDARQLQEKQDNEDQKLRNMGIEPKQRPKIQPQPNIVGILQLVNKVDSKITDHDKTLAKQVGFLLGKGIMNVAEHHAVMGMKIDMLKGLNSMKYTVEGQYDHIINQSSRLSSQTAHNKAIKEYSQSLLERNTRAFGQYEDVAKTLQLNVLERKQVQELNSKLEEEQEDTEAFKAMDQMHKNITSEPNNNQVQYQKVFQQVIESQTSSPKKRKTSIRKNNNPSSTLVSQ